MSENKITDVAIEATDSSGTAAVPAKKRVSKKLIAGIAVACAAVLCVGGIFAYLTATDHATNNFTVANQLDMELQEPNWDPDADEDGDGVPDVDRVVPGMVINKDPKIKNIDGTEAWAIMQVRVPVANVRTVLSNGTPEATATQHELFTYTVNDGWEEYGTCKLDASGKYMIHTYFADDPIDVDEYTPTVFDEVTFINIIDEQFTGATQIDVDGFLIQKYGFGNCESAWNAYCLQNGYSY